MSRRLINRASPMQHWDLHYGPNMTPMVDVVMVILVFFMASSAVLGPEWFLRTALPSRRPADQAAPDPSQETRVEVRLSTGPDGRTRVTGAGLSDATLGAFLGLLEQMARDGKPGMIAVALRPAGDVKYQDLVAVHETCRELGIEKVGMAPR